MLTFALLVVVVALSAATPASAQTQNLGLLWDPVPSGNIDHYNVYVGTSPGVHDLLTVQVPASTTSYAFDATPGILYYFAVSAVDSSGIEGPLSLEIDGSIPDFFPIIDRSSTSGVSITPMNLLAYDPDGDVLRYTHTGLPLGLTLSSSGVISGVPISTGSFNVTIRVSDGIFIRSRSFVWTIVQGGAGDNAAPALTITSHTDGQTVSTSSITLSGTATDSGSGANGIRNVWVNGVAAAGGTVSGSGTASWSRSVTLPGSTNSILVEAEDGYLNYTARFLTILRSNQPPALSIASLSSNLASPQVVNTAIGFTASASGGTAPYQFKWWVYDGTAWFVAREWGSSASFTWQPSTPGNYIVAVWARNAGVTTDASQALAQVNYTIATTSTSSASSSSGVLSVTSLTSSVASPQAAGTSIRFTAAVSGGTAPYEFKWWIFNGTAWIMELEWNRSSTLNWAPVTPGNYMVAVWVRNYGVSADASEALAQVNYTVTSSTTTAFSSTAAASPLSVTSLTSSVASPQQVNTSLTFTATATGGSAPYQFKWWIYDGSAWWVAQDWSMSQTLEWFPSTAGSYIVAVWARNAGVFADASQAMTQINYEVTSPNLPLISSLTSDLSSPQMAGTSVTFTAGVVGGSGLYQSKWWVYDGTGWSMVQDWSTTTTFTWRPGLAGNYVVAVWVRNAGVTADASQALAQINYVVASQTVPVVSSLTANLASPQMAGSAVTFTASVVGGVSPYQYKWWVYDGTSWWVAREWSTSRRFTWQPTIPGSYMVAVWVRNAGVTLDASQALAQIPFDVN